MHQSNSRSLALTLEQRQRAMKARLKRRSHRRRRPPRRPQGQPRGQRRQPKTRIVEGFVPINGLRFDLLWLLKKYILERFPSEETVPDGLGDFIAAGMETAGLRTFIGDELLYDKHRGAHEYKNCISAALDRWFREASRKRTPQELDDYYRPCSE
jgi:hypothetical protein